jgi:DNA primase
MIVTSQKIDLLRKLLGVPDVDRRGVNVQFWCPFCKDDNPRKRKLAVRIEDGAAHCWVCGWRTRNIARIAPFVGMRELLPELEKMYGEVKHDSTEPEPPKDLTLPEGFELIGELLEREVRDPDHLACLKYLAERGVSANVAWAYRLGVATDAANRRRIIVPSFDGDGKLNYLTARAAGDAWPKYLNPETNRLSVVFNEIDIDWSRELTIVEGPFDLFSCYGMNATCALGSWLDERYALFRKIILNRTPVVLCFDPDAAVKQNKVADLLLSYGISVRAASWAGMSADVDPGKLGAAFRAFVKAAQPITKTDTFMSKMARVLDSVRLT